MAIGCLAWIASTAVCHQPQTRGTAVRLLVSMLLTLFLIVTLKRFSNVACPWSLAEFGGADQIRAPFEWLPAFVLPHPRAQCWPAGHAGTIFCLWGLYFAARRHWPRLQNWTLAALFIVGLPLSFGPMMQGAHFLSYTIETILLGFVVAWICFRIPVPHRKASASPRPRTASQTPVPSVAAL